MTNRLHRRTSVLVAFIAISVAAGAGQEQAPLQTQALNALPWRHIGPAAFGGRIDDVEAVAGRPQVIFVGAASGGIFKSVNSGTTWKPVFDEAGTMLSIGDLAIAPSDPNIVWAGTGEPNGPAELLVGRRRLQVARRRRDLDPRRPSRDAPRRPHRHSPDQPGNRVRGRARPALGTEPGARPLPDA